MHAVVSNARTAPLLALFTLLASCPSSSPQGAPADAGPIVDATSTDAGAGDIDAADADASLDDPPIPARYQALATAFDQERQTLGASGAAVALIENGQVTFFHGFGTKSTADPTPVRARTLFRIGSMTKALTATAFLQLAETGAVSVDATLKSVVPDVTVWDPNLTMRELLSHQSGLYDYIVVNASADDAALTQYLTGGAFAQNEYFMYSPGTFWNYANPNFYLTGLALERAGGALYRDAVATRVLAPLGMSRTFFLPSEVIADGDYADGLSKNADGTPWYVAPSSYDNVWARPAGYAFSSVLDYAKLVQFFYAGNPAVLTDADREAMQTPQVDTREYGDVEGYGFALFVDQGFHLNASYYATKLVSHGGDIPGYASDFYLIPSSGFGMVIFANADDAHFGTSLVLAMQSFGGLPAPGTPPSSIAVDPGTFPSFAGTYEDPHNVGRVIVTATASGLSVSMPDLDSAQIAYDATMTPATAGNFVLTIQGEQVLTTFLPDATGAYAWLRTRYFVAERESVDGGATGDAGDDGGDAGEGGAPAVHRFDASAFRARLRARL